MGDFVVRRSVRETLSPGNPGTFVVRRAVRESLLGGAAGDFVVRRAVREVLVGTVPWPDAGSPAIPKRAAQIIG